MKLTFYPFASWFDAALHGRRRWYYLAGNLFSLLLACIPGLTWSVLGLLLLGNATLLMYLLHRHHAFGQPYQRTPRPKDAQCETVLIDASLIGHGVRLRAAAQPLQVAEGLSMRLGSGALLLGSAMVLTADELPPEDRAALLSAVNGLNLKPSRLLIHNPVLRRERDGDVTIVTVRDGLSNRRYYLGTPADLVSQCGMIWDGSPRKMTEDDCIRIDDTAAYIAQGECRVLAWATALESEAPIFLGLGGLGEEVHLSAVQDVATLRGMGLTLMLDAGAQSDTDLNVLRAMLELPEHHARADLHLTPNAVTGEIPLGITRMPGESLVEPVLMLKKRFSIIEGTLHCFFLALGLPLCVAAIAGAGPLMLYLVILLLAAGILVGTDLTAPPLRWPTVVSCGLLAFLSRAFMYTQPAALRFMVGGILAVTVGYCTMRRLCGYGFQYSVRARNPAFWLTAAGALMLLLLVVFGLFQGAACLLPLGYAVLLSTVMALLILLEQRIFP